MLLEITNSMTSRLDLRHLVEVLSTNLFRVMRCDFSALLLPDAESGELRVTILYNPESRGDPSARSDGADEWFDLRARLFRNGKRPALIASKRSATILKFSVITDGPTSSMSA